MIESESSKMYELLIRQQPDRARMQGQGEKDRRHIDPPPVVQLFKRGDDGILSSNAPVPYMLVLHASLWLDLSTSYGADHEFVDAAKLVPCQKELIGSSVGPIQTILDTLGEKSYQINSPNIAPPNYSHYANKIPITSSASNELKLLENESFSEVNETINTQIGHFFIFSDLSVRNEGVYRLKFSLFDLSGATPDGTPQECLCEVFSNRFTVFSVKKFPGMSESTPLSKALAGQGLRIPIRNEARNNLKDDD